MPRRRTIAAFIVSFLSLFPAISHAQDISDERKVEILATMNAEGRRLLSSPPYCWGYKGPRREWPKQGQWTDADFKEFQASAAKRQEVWLNSIGKQPPLTCEEYYS